MYHLLQGRVQEVPSDRGHSKRPQNCPKRERANLAIFQTQRSLIPDYHLTNQVICSNFSLPVPDPKGPEEA